jgi:hypothetical protein
MPHTKRPAIPGAASRATMPVRFKVVEAVVDIGIVSYVGW